MRHRRSCREKGSNCGDSLVTVGVLAACGSGKAPCGGGSGDGKLTMGFSQVGAESGWRTANTKSIQEAAKAADVDLKFSDAGGEQENQISAIRSFVQQRVKVIAFSPVVRTGWDAVLLEAKNAGIPVILTDRAVDTQEKDVYKTFIGADFVQEGQWAGDWVVKQFASAPGPGQHRPARRHHRIRSGARAHVRVRQGHRRQPQPQDRRHPEW